MWLLTSWRPQCGRGDRQKEVNRQLFKHRNGKCYKEIEQSTIREDDGGGVTAQELERASFSSPKYPKAAQSFSCELLSSAWLGSAANPSLQISDLCASVHLCSDETHSLKAPPERSLQAFSGKGGVSRPGSLCTTGTRVSTLAWGWRLRTLNSRNQMSVFK